MNRWTRLAAVAVAALATAVGCGAQGSGPEEPYAPNGMRTVAYAGRISQTQSVTIILSRLPSQSTDPGLQENHVGLGIQPAAPISHGVEWQLPFHQGSTYMTTALRSGLLWSNTVKAGGLPVAAGAIQYPPSNATSVDRVPRIEWDSIEGAKSYLVQIFEVPGGNQPPVLQYALETAKTSWLFSSTGPLFYHASGSDLKPTTTYAIEVFALDASGWAIARAPESIFETGF